MSPAATTRAREVKGRLALLAASTCVALLLAEGWLRLRGFSFRLYPETIEFGFLPPAELRRKYAPDPDLMWVPLDYGRKLARLRADPPWLLCLGDSVTELGTYPRLVREQLARDHPGQRLTVDKLGVAGWSSYQGRRQLARDVVPLRPRVAAIAFGWNDHWVGFGVQDKEVARLQRGAWRSLGRLRLAQLLQQGWVAARRETADAHPRRVTRADFLANLEAMASDARAAGIAPLLVTLPAAHERGHEPPGLRARFLPDLGELVPLHQSYVAAVREASAASGAPLCDIAADFERVPLPERRARLFLSDGIHLTAEGDARFARALCGCLQRAGWPPGP